MPASQLPPCLELPAHMPHVDLEQIEMLASVDDDGGSGLLSELVVLFITENEPRLAQVEKTCQSRDAEALRKHAHFLAGSTANLGILRVSNLCRQVERAIMEGGFDAFDQFPGQLQMEYRAGIEQIKKIAKIN